MLVCHCKALTDRTVRRAIARGADTVAEVGRACGAGSVCGGCRPVIAEIVQEKGAPRSDASAALPSPSE